MKTVIVFTVLITLISVCRGYFVTVDAHAEECFFDKVTKGTKMGLTFEVAEGGFLDIDVEVWVYQCVVQKRQDYLGLARTFSLLH